MPSPARQCGHAFPRLLSADGAAQLQFAHAVRRQSLSISVNIAVMRLQCERDPRDTGTEHEFCGSPSRRGR